MKVKLAIERSSSAPNRLVAESGDPHGSKARLTVSDVNDTFNRVAATCDFSSSDLRRRHDNGSRTMGSDLLVDMFRRMSAQEIKWAMRLLLKDLRPAVIPVMLALQLVCGALPRALQVLNSFSRALAFIQSEEERQGKKLSSQEPQLSLKPDAGMLVGLPQFEKFRSIAHGRRRIHSREVSVERKYDGEYCQVPVSREGNSQM